MVIKLNSMQKKKKPCRTLYLQKLSVVRGLSLQILDEIYVESSLELESFGILKDATEHKNGRMREKGTFRANSFTLFHHTLSSYCTETQLLICCI